MNLETSKRSTCPAKAALLRLLTILCALALVLPATGLARGETSPDAARYGESLSGSTTLRIAELLEDPERYLGKKVTIEGLVDDVCPMMGCWIDVLDEQSTQKIRFKVDDGVIEFPAEARGQAVVAEGVVQKLELSREQAVAYLEHLAEEKGERFDPASVDGPLVLFQLEGLGAELTDP